MKVGDLVRINPIYPFCSMIDMPTWNVKWDPGYVGGVNNDELCILLGVEFSQIDCEEFSQILTSKCLLGWLPSRMIIKL